ncbi:TPA: glycosyltransferase [Klebsiella variicola subsp. variicola]|uniref:glycosyltransferase family 2 protein n=1 Tax=Klebsiella variicola TaxID=244366 RepID=UPI001887A6DE|nr:glycosyltransferase [Klebsiella variicola]HCB1195046.1 glycosyltransferase [Klebsiella variicola subsp. variicola]
MHDISLVVVLYGKELQDSKTLMSLSKFEFKFNTLLVYNNGPSLLSTDNTIVCMLKNRFEQVTVIEDITNAPLSKIYNFFLKNVKSNSYVILDDDTELNENYIFMLIQNASKQEYDLVIPKIISFDARQYYPISNGVVIEKEGYIEGETNLLSISSGIVLNKSIFRKMLLNDNNMFDERYALYGVDTSFFKKITKNPDVKICISSYLSHSLSRAESKDNYFRRKERLIDLAISTRCYPSLFNYYYFLKKLISLLFSCEFKLAILMIHVFLKGRHPKC